jgi:hypothetical protein
VAGPQRAMLLEQVEDPAEAVVGEQVGGHRCIILPYFAALCGNGASTVVRTGRPRGPVRAMIRVR